MPQTLTKYTLNCTQGNTVYTAWIDVRNAKRLRLFIPSQQGGEFTASIDQSTVDPAQNTPIVKYGVDYMCGQTDSTGYVPQTEVFDRTVLLGADYIKIALTNISAVETMDVFLLQETIA